MARFFDVGVNATGFIAVGQFATGVIAFGQSAIGVIAIGQLARGVIAVGQLALGVVSYGMLSVGVVRATGMVGVAGTRGLGFVLPLVPALRPVPEGSDVVSLAHIAANGGPDWVALVLSVHGPGDVILTEPGQAPAVKLAAGLLASARKAASGGTVRVRGRVERVGSMLVCDELTVLSQPARRIYLDIGLGVLILSLTILAIVFWSFVGLPLFATLGRL